MSILTFNASVQDRNIFKVIKEPFQIMPTTHNFLTDNMIAKYPEASNENLLIHMNYITRVFSDNAIETNSKVRYGLRQYYKLAKKLGTHNILIHMPNTKNEYENVVQGLRIIHEELLNKEFPIIVHLEIAPWSRDLLNELNPGLKGNCKQYIARFVDLILHYVDQLDPEHWRLVFDTAHLFALGCEVEDQIELYEMYKGFMEFAHLNGNVNSKFVSDSHVPIWSGESKLKRFEVLSKYLASSGLMCVAEVTKSGGSYDNWKKYASDFGFKLVEFNNSYSI